MYCRIVPKDMRELNFLMYIDIFLSCRVICMTYVMDENPSLIVKVFKSQWLNVLYC